MPMVSTAAATVAGLRGGPFTAGRLFGLCAGLWSVCCGCSVATPSVWILPLGSAPHRRTTMTRAMPLACTSPVPSMALWRESFNSYPLPQKDDGKYCVSRCSAELHSSATTRWTGHLRNFKNSIVNSPASAGASTNAEHGLRYPRCLRRCNSSARGSMTWRPAPWRTWHWQLAFGTLSWGTHNGWSKRIERTGTSPEPISGQFGGTFAGCDEPFAVRKAWWELWQKRWAVPAGQADLGSVGGPRRSAAAEEARNAEKHRKLEEQLWQ